MSTLFSTVYSKEKQERNICIPWLKDQWKLTTFLYISLSSLSSLITPMNPNPTTQSLSSQSGDFSSSHLSLSLSLPISMDISSGLCVEKSWHLAWFHFYFFQYFIILHVLENLGIQLAFITLLSFMCSYHRWVLLNLFEPFQYCFHRVLGYIILYHKQC